MRYWKLVKDGIILAIGTGESGKEISEAEYRQIDEVVSRKPTPPNGYDYHLRENLEWEKFQLPVISGQRL